MPKFLSMEERHCMVPSPQLSISLIFAAAGFWNFPKVVAALLLGGADPSIENCIGVSAKDDVCYRDNKLTRLSQNQTAWKYMLRHKGHWMSSIVMT